MKTYQSYSHRQNFPSPNSYFKVQNCNVARFLVNSANCVYEWSHLIDAVKQSELSLNDNFPYILIKPSLLSN